MAKKKIIPIDLSKYEKVSPLPSSIEIIIVQGLIITEGNIESISSKFNLSVEKVNEIYIRHYLEISNVIDQEKYNNDADICLNKSLKMYKKHISELEKYNSNNKKKLMTDSTIRSINSMVDRISNIKENNIRSYDSAVNKMIESILKSKHLELSEFGPQEDTSISDSNCNTFIDAILNKTPKRGNTKSIIVTDTESNTEKEYSSIKDAARDLNTTSNYISVLLSSQRLLQNRYKFRYKE